MRAPACSISVVSHGQGALVDAFLSDLERHCSVSLEVIVVINVPEDDAFVRRPRPFPVTVVRNTQPKGFGANHNAAFEISGGEVFVIANPDIRLTHDPLPALLDLAHRPGVGICGPKVVSPAGVTEDSARHFPTVRRLLERRLRRPRRLDFAIGDTPLKVDWLAGMFLALRREVYRSLGGFDERYFMYCEDVDLCYRAGKAGFDVLLQPAACVVHDARRESHRSARHMLWHIASTARFLLSQPRELEGRGATIK